MVPLALRPLAPTLLGAQAALLVASAGAAGLGAVGWLVAVGCAVILDVCVAVWLARSGRRRPGPADLVTLVRASAACLVAGLTADAVALHRPSAPVLVAIATAALLLDAVDGWVARWTRSTPFGAKLDGEADAFLILVLSVDVAHTVGAWVLAAGVVRYVFGGAGWVLAWLDPVALPFRYWRKVVTAASGTILVLAASQLLPGRLTLACLVGVLLLLGESFGRDVWWLWSRRDRAEPAAGRLLRRWTGPGAVARSERGSARGLV